MSGSDTEKNGPKTAFDAQKGKGRPKGVPNKSTVAVKDMVVTALTKAGGADYLLRQSEENPSAFMTLIGKVIPLQVAGQLDVTILSKEQRDAIAARVHK